MNIKSLKVGTRLSLGFGSVCVLLLIIVTIGSSKLAELNLGTKFILEDRWPKIELATNTLSQVDLIAISLRNMMLNENREDRQKQIDTIMGARKKSQSNIEELDKKINNLEGDEKLKRVIEAGAKYVEGQDKLLALIQADKPDESKTYLANELRPSLATYKATLNDLIKLQIAKMDETGKEAQDTYVQARNLMIILGALAVMVAVVTGFVITRSLTRQLGGEPDYAVEIVGRIAAGDLSLNVEVKQNDQSSLLYAMKCMRDQLSAIVNQVRTGTETIATASSEIASGSIDLSSRTEEQASSLEETASSMEELTSTVKQNADNARQANQLALTASEIAGKGGVVVGEVVDTMVSINQSSKKIVEIISVIDGIAFQTNILALNAAVEAARAGEQGRGFAVVASEVRNLAQRSAAAAKEIKTLISDSVEKVDSGAKLVDQAGVTMDEIVDSVKRVTDIMGEIMAASQEQTAGIEQINQAVSQMDQVTQQNAALVEQAAAASESMQEQAKQLSDTVSVFKLNGTLGASAVKVVNPRLKSTPQARANAAKPARPLTHQTKRLAATATKSNDGWEEF